MSALPLPASLAPAPTAHRRIGRYEVIREIASGGMATVYVARALGPRGFSRIVALKRLHPHLAADDDFVRMFLDEARIASGLRHPNVVATLDIDDSEGLSLVMEYVDGLSLLDVTRAAAERRERLPVGVSVRVTLDVLAGLQAAHDLVDEEGNPAGVVHRDVSPHNVLLDRTGTARITDFGVARATTRLTCTRDGRVKGKLSYMAPEQVTGDRYDHRADVFAAGVVAWELLSGRRLFAGAHDAQVLHALLYEPVPALDAKVPRRVAAAVMRALHRDPSQRWRSCAAFAEALESAAPRDAGTSPRAVAALVRRYDRGGDRFRASLTSLPGVSADEAGRVSGVISREPDAPECTFDVIELIPEEDRLPEVELTGSALVEVTEPAPDPRGPDANDLAIRQRVVRPTPRWVRVGAAVAGVVAALGASAALVARSTHPPAPSLAPPAPPSPALPALSAMSLAPPAAAPEAPAAARRAPAGGIGAPRPSRDRRPRAATPRASRSRPTPTPRPSAARRTPPPRRAERAPRDRGGSSGEGARYRRAAGEADRASSMAPYSRSNITSCSVTIARLRSFISVGSARPRSHIWRYTSPRRSQRSLSASRLRVRRSCPANCCPYSLKISLAAPPSIPWRSTNFVACRALRTSSSSER
ncbi:MAG: serine/threonine-protein kinase [Polyangiales bacterium]